MAKWSQFGSVYVEKNYKTRGVKITGDRLNGQGTETAHLTDLKIQKF